MYSEALHIGKTLVETGSGKYIALLAAVFIISYLAGNISPATIIGKAKGIDIRKEEAETPERRTPSA